MIYKFKKFKKLIVIIITTIIINIFFIRYTKLNYPSKKSANNSEYIVITTKINEVIDSSILNKNEMTQLLVLTGLSSLKRVYRASIDGFKSTSFHANVDHKPVTNQMKKLIYLFLEKNQAV